jgi:hypothetical protein
MGIHFGEHIENLGNMVETSLGTVGWDTLGTWWEHQNPPKSFFPSSPLSLSKGELAKYWNRI